MIKGIHHIAFIFKNLNEIVPYFEKLGLEYVSCERFEARGADVVLFRSGNVLIELISPYTEGVVQKFLDSNGEGFFHMAFAVEDLDKHKEIIEEKGLKFKEDKPTKGINWELMNLHDTPLGLIIQLVKEK